MRPAHAGQAELDDAGSDDSAAASASSLSDSALQSAVDAVLRGGELHEAATARTVREAVERSLGLPVDALLPRKLAVLAAIKRAMEARASQPQQQQPASSSSSFPAPSQSPYQQQSLASLKRTVQSSESSATAMAGRVKRSRPETGQAWGRQKSQQSDGSDGEHETEAAEAGATTQQPLLSSLSQPASSASFASAARRAAAPAGPASSSPARPASAAGEGEDDAALLSESHIPGKVADLGANKLITVSPFQSRVLVQVREYFRDRESQQRRPGKRGIALTVDQFEQMMAAAPRIRQQILACQAATAGAGGGGQQQDGDWDAEAEGGQGRPSYGWSARGGSSGGWRPGRGGGGSRAARGGGRGGRTQQQGNGSW